MISVRLAEQSDSEKWDTYVCSHPDASPYHLFAWSKAISKAYRHQSLYFIAEDNNTIVGILPTIQLRFPFLLNELVSLPYCDTGGCLCDNQEVLEAILFEAISFGKKNKVNKIQLRGQLDSDQVQASSFIKERSNKVRMFLDLPESSEILMHNFKSKLRSQIKKAGKNNLVFQWGSGKELDDYYRVFSENMHKLGSPVHSRDFFSTILKYYQDKSKMGLVYYKQLPIGAGLIFCHGTTVSIPWASTLREYNQLAPNMLLYWNFLKYSSDKGYKTFDFGRSSKGEGTYKFKAQWGAKPTPLEWYFLRANGTTREKNKGNVLPNRRLCAEIWQKLPLRLATYLGPKIRKYISL